MEYEIISRRLQETPSAWYLLIPVLFALVVFFLIRFYRQDEPLSGLLSTFFIPKSVVTWLTIIWGLGVVLYTGVFLSLALAQQFFPDAVYLGFAAPLVLIPALAGLLALITITLRQPTVLIPLFFLLVVSGIYLLLGYVFLDAAGWLIILFPVVLAGLFYVAIMYSCDARSVHPLWAMFLAILRCAVYVCLAVVFLLFAIQMFDTSVTYSKVLVLFDVSDSMQTKELVGEKGSKETTRQEQVLAFLTEQDNAKNVLSFLDRVKQKSPASLYRFGTLVDDSHVIQIDDKSSVSDEKLQKFLVPNTDDIVIPDVDDNGKELSEEEKVDLRGRLLDLYSDLKQGTNITGSALQAVLKETSHKLQAVIIVSDGQSNFGSSDTYLELVRRANSKKRPFHIVTVGVGRFSQDATMVVQDIQAPQQARPDDKFPVRVPVVGQGLPNAEFPVKLEVSKVVKNGDNFQPTGFKTVLNSKGKFQDRGDQQYAEVEFEIDLRKIKGISPNDESQDEELEGYWEFRAIVPAHAKERKQEPHETKRPSRVLVQKRKLRVLLFAGGPTREYQFVRTLFFREVQENRVDLYVYLQTGVNENVNQDVEREKMLTSFPTKLGRLNASDTDTVLTDFDVIFAFDPDWTELTPAQMNLLNRWVSGPTAGGFVFIAGPVNTYQLATAGGRKIDDLQSLVPVTLKDSRLIGLGIGHDASRPYELQFTEGAKELSFLNISENAEDPMKGWQEFFWDGEQPPAGKVSEPYFGFYNYYPVKKLKPAAKVLATFPASASGQTIEPGLEEQPFIVTMPNGAGKTVYLGSGEFWRLRQYDEEFHQRFWVKLARYAGGGNLSKANQYGTILLVQQSPVGPIKIEAQVLGDNMLPLPRDARPEVLVKRPDNFDEKLDTITDKAFKLQAKPAGTDWNGWFSGTFKAFTPGEYTLKIPIPGAPNNPLTATINVFKPDPELANVKPNHGFLYQLATTAQPVLERMEGKARQDLLTILRPPTDEKGKTAEVGEGEDTVRLYFPLENADSIADLLVEIQPDEVSKKGALRDIWDLGFGGSEVPLFNILLFAFIAVIFFASIFLVTGLLSKEWIQSTVAGLFLAVCVVGLLGTLFFHTVYVANDPGTEWVKVSLQATGFMLLLVVPPGIGLIISLILVTIRQWTGAAALFAVTVVFFLGVIAVDRIFQPTWAVFPLQASYVLLLIVGLLSLEWLTRKLLRLA